MISVHYCAHLCMKCSLGISSFSHCVIFPITQTGVMGKFGHVVDNEAGDRLIKFCHENAMVIANTLVQKHKRRLYTWTSPDSQY